MGVNRERINVEIKISIIKAKSLLIDNGIYHSIIIIKYINNTKNVLTA